MLDHLLKPEIQELIRDRDLWEVRRVLADWEPHEWAGLIHELPVSDDVIVFRLLPRELAADTFEHLAPEERRVAAMLLGYPEDSVGRLMTTEYVAVRPAWTIRQALDHTQTRHSPHRSRTTTGR